MYLSGIWVDVPIQYIDREDVSSEGVGVADEECLEGLSGWVGAAG